MFLVYGEGNLLNLDKVIGIGIDERDGVEGTHYVVEACLSPERLTGDSELETLVSNCASKEVALKHIANIANAIQIGKPVYVIGTDPHTDLLPSEYMTIG